MSRAGRRIAVSTSPGSSRHPPRRRRARAGRAWSAVRALPACVTTVARARRCAPTSPTCARKLDEIDKRDKEYKEQVVRLRKVLDQATKLLTRNSADVGAKAAKAEQDIAVLQGRIEELAHTMELAEPAGGRRAQPAGDAAGGAGADAEQDRRQGRARRCPTTRNSCGSRRRSASRRASATTAAGSTACSSSASRRTRARAQAYLAIGMSFVQESKYPNAAAEFQKVLHGLPVVARGAGGDVAAVAGVRAAALLHRRARAARAIS